MKKVLAGIGIVLGAVVLLVLGYCIYMLATYHRIEDRQPLEIKAPAAAAENIPDQLKTNEPYRALTFNIGFGAYIPEFSFFMDGGAHSWAIDEEGMKATVLGASEKIRELDVDFALVQEIDIKATRSYNVNQYDLVNSVLKEYYSDFAVNYDSSFLALPLTEPHGFVKAGIATYGKYPMTEGMRRSLPITKSLSKYVDLDRCYSVSRVPVENGKDLVIINVHLTAYGGSDEVREGQTSMLREEFERECAAGNYVICGGDFNHDMKMDPKATLKEDQWAYPYPRETLPEGIRLCIDDFSQEEKQDLWDSCRSSGKPYVEGESDTITLDGFMISDNVEMISYEHINTGYAYSDHEPVVLGFQLKD